MAFSKKNLINLMRVAIEHGASDIHIRTDEVPSLRIHGDLVPVKTKEFTAQDVSDVANLILHKQEHIDNLSNIYEVDGGLTIPNLCRVRYNLFHYDDKLGIILRIISDRVPSLKELGLPSALSKITERKRGLILLTGPTGCGKTTTLAAMINKINNERKCHVITIEDPVEYLHKQKLARITQREIGKDTLSYNEALRAALRQDPDVILVGEMRDTETISIALKAAETGHVVYSTVHTTDAISTIGRIISMFPAKEQNDVRKRLAINLYALISQRMMKKVGGGVIIAQEIMVSSPGVKECIRGDEPIANLAKIMREHSGRSGNGSQTFDQHIMLLYHNGIISEETALATATSKDDFKAKLALE